MATAAIVLADCIDICLAWYLMVVATGSDGAPNVSTADGTKSKPRSGTVAVSVSVTINSDASNACSGDMAVRRWGSQQSGGKFRYVEVRVYSERLCLGILSMARSFCRCRSNLTIVASIYEERRLYCTH